MRSDFHAPIVSLSSFAFTSRDSKFRLPFLVIFSSISFTVLR